MFWNFLASPKRYNRRKEQDGFGLIELMVSISVIVIVTSIILIRQNAFNSAVLIRSQAYEVALQVREVQLSALGASGDSGDFRTVYGVHFNTATGEDGNYIIFADRDGDNYYDPGVEEVGAPGVIDPRFEIRSIKVGDSSEPQISVVFIRPNFDALFYDDSGQIVASEVKLEIARRGAEVSDHSIGVSRTIEVTSTGQIGVINSE